MAQAGPALDLSSRFTIYDLRFTGFYDSRFTALMKIVISTFGSFGDVHPYVALALELKRRGHRPVVATSEVYREKMEAVGLELHPVRPQLPSYDEPDEVSRMVVDFMDRHRGTERIVRWVSSHLEDAYADTLAAVE